MPSALNSFAHGDVLAEALELFAVGFALGGFGGEGFGNVRGWRAFYAEAGFELFYTGGKCDEGVGERVFDVVGIGYEDALAIAIDDVSGDAYDGGVGGDVREYDGAGADAGVFADGDVAEDVGVVADEDAVADGGVALAVALAGAAESDSLVDGDIAADDCRFADDDARCVVNEEPATEECGGVNIDAGVEAGDLGDDARGQWQAGAPEGVGDAMKPDGPEAWIAEKDFKAGAGSGIALHYGVDVFADAVKHGHGLQEHKWGGGRRNGMRPAGSGIAYTVAATAIDSVGRASAFWRSDSKRMLDR
jgi:hypothetical protein